MSEHDHDVRAQLGEGQDRRPLSISARLGRLQFHHSGKFRVLQFADLQDGPKVSKDAIALMRAALEAARPDIVIFTGNQIAGYDPAYAATYRERRWRSTNPSETDIERTKALVRQQIGQFVQPLIDAGVPWAVTYGNHDFQCGLSNAELDSIYREFEGCVNGDASEIGDATFCQEYSAALPDELIFACEPGTFGLPVLNEQGTRPVLGLVLLDSGDYARSGGYGTPSARGLKFLKIWPRIMGRSVQSVVFQHTAMPQYYELFRPVAANAAHAIEGYRMFAGQHYVLDETKVRPGGYLGEGVSCPDTDDGEFAILEDTKGYCAVVAGHDHRNAFDGSVQGIRLIETPTCGFEAYGPVPAKRAARLFEFDIRHPFNPRTQLLEFGELVGKPSSKKAYVYGMTAASKSESEGVDLLHKPSWLRRFFTSLMKS